MDNAEMIGDMGAKVITRTYFTETVNIAFFVIRDRKPVEIKPKI